MSNDTASANNRDGRHDFDFWFGSWAGHTRKLLDVTDPDCTKWIELDHVSEAWPVLGGLGNVDTIRFEGDASFEGVSFRLYDPERRTWRIWWASTNYPGRLDQPTEGAFEDGVGTFECDDVLGGREVRVRYVWSDITPDSARWRQYFRWTPDADWALNWETTFTRTNP
jgi:hypothetical protein